ncbi:hypothetical protein CBR_g54797 [Chara braunii]|uniref:Ubiquitin-like domain-containing protein n=1 Tax=Chara braunii TaxID=69332 RepID=A0A388JPQ1_CHABU|nr:hypothetical protein CBR_g54797 [Chara braunii]|eukprot:GBG59692.1 hypothetical protein CBR_g54797 [Chara braunii]
MGVTVHVKCSNGAKFTVDVDLNSTVKDLKTDLAGKSEIPVEQQRLIYKGRVLKDDNSLSSYGLEAEHTIHLVRGAAATAASAGAVGTGRGDARLAGAATPASAPAGTPDLDGGLGGFGGLGGLGGFGAGLGGIPPDMHQMHQQILQNPNLMRDMMNSPAVQSIMSNPDLMRNLIMSNPHLREVLERNPDLMHVLNDPGILRQTMNAVRNPELMREMMRNTDRAMSNIEAHPEGFNMLRRMYETVQEPLMNATTRGGDAGAGDLAGNPFAALFGGVPAAAQAGGGTTAGATTAPAVPSGPAPNTAPLPNPWSPQQRTPAGTASAGITTATAGGVTTPGSATTTATMTTTMGSAGVGATPFGLLPEIGLMDPATMLQMLQNPAMQQVLQSPAMNQMMQTLLSDPSLLGQLTPQMRTMLDNPRVREMLQSPDFIQQMQSLWAPQLQALQGLGGAMGTQGDSTTAGAPAPDINLNALLSILGGQPGGAPASNIPPEQQYAAQLSQLEDMGFYDSQDKAYKALNAS